MIVPTLCVGTHPVTLRITLRKTQAVCQHPDAERPWPHSHAERWNDQRITRLLSTLNNTPGE